MLSIFGKLLGWKNTVMSHPAMDVYRRFVRPALGIIAAATDIGVSKNKGEAVTANALYLPALMAVRNRRGLIAFAIPSISYAIGRTAGHYLLPHRGEQERVLPLSPITEATAATFPALPEEGLAPEQRHALTDFGSAWLGPVVSLAAVAGTSFASSAAGGSFGSGLATGIGGATFGWMMGGAQGAVIGGVAGSVLGAALGSYLRRERNETTDRKKSALKWFTISLAVDTAKDISMMGMVRGGLWYEATRGGLERVFGADRLAAGFKFISGRDYRGPTGFAFNITDLPWMQKLTSRMHPKTVKQIAAAFGNPYFLKELEAAGGLETLSRSRIAKAMGRDILAGLPLAAVGGALGYLYARKKRRNKPVNAIKAHDAGRWGREQTFASGDFEPGSSWKGLWQGIGRIFAGIGSQLAALPGRIGRLGQMGSVLGKEAISGGYRFLRHEAIPGALHGRWPELSYLGLNIGQAFSGVGGAAGFAATGIASKIGYVGVKVWQRFGDTIRFYRRLARQFPALARARREIIRETAKELLGQTGRYIWRGESNPVATYFRLGGGRLGKQGFINEVALELGELADVFRLPTNINANIISGLHKSGLGASIRKFFSDFGSPWKGLISGLRRLFGRPNWARIRSIVEPFTQLSAATRTVEEFAMRSGAVLAKGPSAYFPEKFITPYAGRTILETATPIVAHPGLLAKRGYALAEHELGYRGAIVHEHLEAAYSKTVDETFLAARRHAHAEVVIGTGYFYGATGATMRELKMIHSGSQDIRLIKKGWRKGRQLFKKELLVNKAANKITGHRAAYGATITERAVGSDFTHGKSWTAIKILVERGVKTLERFGTSMSGLAKVSRSIPEMVGARNISVSLIESEAQYNALKSSLGWNKSFAEWMQSPKFQTWMTGMKSGEALPLNRWQEVIGGGKAAQEVHFYVTAPHPQLLAKQGLWRDFSPTAYATGAVHEAAEIQSAMLGLYNPNVFKQFGHISEWVPRAQGFFKEAVGIRADMRASNMLAEEQLGATVARKLLDNRKLQVKFRFLSSNAAGECARLNAQRVGHDGVRRVT